MKKKTLVLLTAFVLILSACTTHTHVVGNGAQGNYKKSKRQLWVISLVAINDVDTQALAGGATDYEITTQSDIVDLIIGGFTGGLIVSRKVTVTK